MSDFKPRVTQVGLTWYGTMPHSIRDRAWDKTCAIQDNVVSMDSTATRLILEVNDGHKTEEGLFIMVTAIYLAMNSLDYLLASTTPEAHLHQMRVTIDYGVGFDISETIPYLEKYILDQVESIISNDYQAKPIYLPYITDRRDIVVAAKNRLEFTPLSACTILPWEKSKRLGQCDKMIEKFDQAFLDAAQINIMIEVIKKSATEAFDNFMKLAKENPLGCDETFDLFRAKIQAHSLEASDLFEKFYKYHNFDAWVKEILAITPPAPTK